MARTRFSPETGGSAYRTWILWGLGIVLVAWIAFFDSHSVLKRIQWRMEYEDLRAENERLREEITRVRDSIQAIESDEMIERIAREQYGMSRPGETVYRIQPQE